MKRRGLFVAATLLSAACGVGTPELTSGEYVLSDFGVEKDACKLQQAFPLSLTLQVDSDEITLTTVGGEATPASGTIDGERFTASGEGDVDCAPGHQGGCKIHFTKSFRGTITADGVFEGAYTYDESREGWGDGLADGHVLPCTSALTFRARRK